MQKALTIKEKKIINQKLKLEISVHQNRMKMQVPLPQKKKKNLKQINNS